MDSRQRLYSVVGLGLLGLCAALAWSYARGPAAERVSGSRHELVVAEGVSVTAEVGGDDYLTARITVSGHGGSFTSESFGFGGTPEAAQAFVAGLKAQTGWKDGVLFVPHSCGGGNAWRCEQQILYAVHEGRLVELGAVLAGFPEDPVGSRLVDGLIDDTFDVLESNGLTSHAGAPGFGIVLRVGDGRLAVDQERTWAMNEEEFQRNQALLGCGLPGAVAAPPCGPPLDEEERVSRALWNAALAKYCGRAAELDAALALARQLFAPEVAGRFERELALIEPGAPMRSFFRGAAPQA